MDPDECLCFVAEKEFLVRTSKKPYKQMDAANENISDGKEEGGLFRGDCV